MSANHSKEKSLGNMEMQAGDFLQYNIRMNLPTAGSAGLKRGDRIETSV